MTDWYCRGCASDSVATVVEDTGRPTAPCESCGRALWSRRRSFCAHCATVGYPYPDTLEADHPPARTRPCIRGHSGPWREDPGSAWVLGGVPNRMIKGLRTRYRTGRLRDTVDIETDILELGQRATRAALFDNQSNIRLRFGRVRDRAQDAVIASQMHRLRRGVA